MSEQAHMTSLFENATEGIILTDRRGSIMMVNPAAVTMFGYTEEELLNKTIDVLLPDNARKYHHQLRDTFYQQPANRAMGQGRDLYAKKKDGGNIPVEVSLSHYEKDGEMFVIAFIVDITLRKNIERDLLRRKEELEEVTQKIKKLNEELEAKVQERTKILKEALEKLEQSQQELSEALDKERQLNEMKSRFVSMASHEFRTPLTTVLSSASLLAKYVEEADASKREKHILRIKNSVNNLNSILNDFLSLGHLDEGKTIVHKEPVQLVEVLNEVLEEMKSFLKSGQEVVLDFNIAEAVYTDKRLVRNILINLLGNAIKFSSENKSIFVKGYKKEGRVIISVEDKGMGIAKEDIPHLFSSFFRAANATNIQGTGLGLHIVKRYITLLEGDIHLESELNKGTIVIFSLPVK